MPVATFPTEHFLILVLGLASAALGAWLALRQSSPIRLRVHRRAAQQLVVGPLTYGSASERRDGFRRKGGRVKVRLAGPGASEEPCIGWVVDRSPGGLRLRLRARLEKGAVVSIRPVHAPERLPSVQVEVRSCRPGDGGWEVGCRFVRRPSWDVMLHFG
jgi:hypothetical protein